ncbi:MAG: endonuclease [Eubacterium sp.]|nr:endonuclease [Eubacterium sp.]
MKKVRKRSPKKLWQKILIGLGVVVGFLLIVVLIFFGWMTAVEYRPEDVEKVEINTVTGQGQKLIQGSSLKVMTWNIGYGALGDDADFFMDGGESVMTTIPERVDVNLAGVAGNISSNDPDIVFLQEVDLNSKRSYFNDELLYLKGEIYKNSTIDWETGIDYALFADEDGNLREPDEYASTFAYNYKAELVPYPFPENLGKVESGISTISKYQISDAERISLPCPFKWPIRTANLKRCLLVNRLPIYDEAGNETDKELVLVNLHLEAYDDGEGKIAQTQQLKTLLQEEYDKGNYVIAGGDFNQTFSNVDTSMYPDIEGTWKCGQIDVKDFSDNWQLLMDNSSPTCRSLDQPYQGADKDNFQYYMIDGFIVSDNIKVDSLQTLNYVFMASDHNPVLMNVTLE